MSDPTVDYPNGTPPAAVRAALDRYLAAWEQAAAGGPPPAPDDALTGVPEPDRARLRPAVEALDAWARARMPTPSAAVETVSVEAPEEPSPPAEGTIDYAPAGASLDTPGPEARSAVLPRTGDSAARRDSGSDESTARSRSPSDPVAPETVDLTPADGSGPATADLTRDTDPGSESADRPQQAPAPQVRRANQVPGHEVLGELGRGGMGVVYKARQRRLGRLVAVKVMLNADHAGTTARGRFDAEAQAIARMQHPNIVQIYEVGETGGVPYFSLEFVPGGTLARKVAKQLLPPRETAALMVTLARAMQYAHDHGIVHRDLKPGNILIAEDGTPKITDFGLAKRLEGDSELTRAGSVVGTPSYMPPEQAAGELEKVGPLADVYSLGAILYDLLTGRPPFKGAHILDTLEQVRTREPLAPSSLQPGVPKDLETICLKCLQKDPAKRYQSAGELADDLQRYLNGEPILARPIGPAERAWRWYKRNKTVGRLLAGVFVLLLLIAGGSTYAAVAINKSREKITRQRDEIAEHEQVVARQRDEYKGLYEAYRSGVDTFVNDAPSVLEGYPFSGPSAELLALTIKLLEDAQGKTDDRGLTERGRLAILIRQGLLDQMQGKPDDARRRFEEARSVAEQLAQPGSPERDKAAGNLALVYNLQAALCQSRGEALTRTDRAAARKELGEAVRLNREALALQQRVLEKPETGEIPPGEVRTWLGSTHAALAVTHRTLARVEDPDAARQALTAALDHARQSEEHSQAGLDSGTLPPRVRERTELKLALSAFEFARVADQLGRPDDADTAFKRAVDRLTGLVKTYPRNPQYKQNLSVVAGEYGDFLLLRRSDPGRAREAYTPAVVHLRPVAQPPELAGLVNLLALNYYRLATAQLRAGNKADAVRIYGLCLDIRQAQLREAERSDAAKKNPAVLVTPKINLMLALARSEKHREAAAIADELAAPPKADPRRLAQAAAGYALSSAAADGDLKQEYMDRAIATLSRAVDAGYADLDFLERDPDLDPAREDDRFQKVVARVRERQGKK